MGTNRTNISALLAKFSFRLFFNFFFFTFFFLKINHGVGENNQKCQTRETDANEEVLVVGGERGSVCASGIGGSRLRLPFGNAAQAGGNYARQRALRRLQEAKEELQQISRLQIWAVELSLREYSDQSLSRLGRSSHSQKRKKDQGQGRGRKEKGTTSEGR